MNGATDTTNGMLGAAHGSKLLWKHPTPESTPMHAYLKAVNHAHDLHLSSYPELHQWSIGNIDAFWQSVWKFVGIRAEGEASPVSQSSEPTAMSTC
jgi:acetoacetyl-CoA synthetase